MRRVGDALVDVGAPMANGEAVVDDSSGGAASQLNGYSIVEAPDAAEANKLVEGAGSIHELRPCPCSHADTPTIHVDG